MKNVKEYIESGILESYVMGSTTPDESKEVEEMLAVSEEIRKEMNAISDTLERYAEAYAIVPNITIRPLVMATIDYTERLKNGEQPAFPPGLHEGSRVTDYAEWLKRPEMTLPEDFKDLHARIIGYTPELLTAIIWIKDMAPPEVHDDEYEKFLIVEGTCDITIDTDVHHLVPGNFLSIPLHKSHFVKVTSDIPCKVVLQRAAA